MNGAKTIVVGGPIFILLIAIMAIFILPASDVKPVDFTNGVHADDILEDPDVKYILSSSIFEDVRTDITHSAERHPGDQELRDKCLNGGGNPVLGMMNPHTGHCVEIIETSAKEGGSVVKRWLVRVVKQVDGLYQEVTAFTDDWEAIYEVEDYLVGGGYMVIWP